MSRSEYLEHQIPWNGASQSNAVVIAVTGASQDELDVQEQTAIRQTRGKRTRALDRVLITEQNNQPVSRATVTAVYSGPNQGEVTGLTGDNGRVYLRTDFIRNPQGVWCFEITNVSKDGYLYSPAANVVTVQCEWLNQAGQEVLKSATSERWISLPVAGFSGASLECQHGLDCLF